jgi:branched-chain amino acid transport system permease protein
MSADSSAAGDVITRPGPEVGGSRRSPWLARLRRLLATYGPALGIVAVQLVFFPVSSGIFVRGIVVGALTALIALGMALIYKANRIVNFAQTHMGYAPALLAFLLMEASGLPYLLALGIALVVAIGIGAATERLVIRRFVRAPRLLLTIATLGLGQLLAGLTRLLPAASCSTPATPWG